MEIKSIFWIFMVTIMSSCISKADVDDKESELWMQLAGEGEPTIVFISGNGSDSSVWSGLVPDVTKMGATTVIYDRAGLGQSNLWQGDYKIDDEARALNVALDNLNLAGPLLLVAHSYGGLIAILTAEVNPRVKGIVLVDALLPDDLSEDVVASTLAQYRPKFKEVEEQAPHLAKAVIPVVEAYPATSKRVQKVKISNELRFIDIQAEHSWPSGPEQLSYIKGVHTKFAAGSEHRTTVQAIGSSHNVPRDRPDVIIQAIADMLVSLADEK
jgi:pimeloyl-ACP methyl ester carboxylesterase